MMFASTLFVGALTAAAAMHAAAALSLSSQCQQTLASVVTSSEAKCLDAQALIGLVVAGTNSSVVGPLNNWLTGMCAAPACTNATLASVVGNVTAGCASDLAAYVIASGDASELTSIVQTAYPTARKAACLSDTANNHTLCVTETLTNAQAITGTLTLSKLASLVSQVAAGGSAPALPSNVTCTSCTQAMYDTVDAAFPGALTGGANNTVAAQCGSNFTSAAMPSSITQTANNAVESTAAAGAAALGVSVHPALSVAFPALLLVSSAFVVFA